jgi:hypothetical protein
MPSIAPLYYLVSLAFSSPSYPDNPINAQWYSYELIELATWEPWCNDFEIKPLQPGMYAWDHYSAGKEYYFSANQDSEGFLRRHPPESDNT